MYLQHHSDRLIKEFEIIRPRANAQKVFMDLGFLTYQVNDSTNPVFETLIVIDGKKYSLVYQLRKGNQFLTDFTMMPLTDYISTTNESVVLLTSLRMTERAQQVIDKFPNTFVVFSFSDEPSLLKQVEAFFLKL